MLLDVIAQRLVFSFPKPTIFSWIERLFSHMGNEKYPTVGSSGEYWSINESLNQGFAGMKSC